MSLRTPTPNPPYPYYPSGVVVNRTQHRKKGLKKGKRVRAKRQSFARERRQEEVFKFGQIRSGLDGLTTYRGRPNNRPSRQQVASDFLAIHNSALANKTRDDAETDRALKKKTLELEDAKQTKEEEFRTKQLQLQERQILQLEQFKGRELYDRARFQKQLLETAQEFFIRGDERERRQGEMFERIATAPYFQRPIPLGERGAQEITDFSLQPDPVLSPSGISEITASPQPQPEQPLQEQVREQEQTALKSRQVSGGGEPQSLAQQLELQRAKEVEAEIFQEGEEFERIADPTREKARVENFRDFLARNKEAGKKFQYPKNAKQYPVLEILADDFDRRWTGRQLPPNSKVPLKPGRYRFKNLPPNPELSQVSGNTGLFNLYQNPEGKVGDGGEFQLNLHGRRDHFEQLIKQGNIRIVDVDEDDPPEGKPPTPRFTKPSPAGRPVSPPKAEKTPRGRTPEATRPQPKPGFSPPPETAPGRQTTEEELREARRGLGAILGRAVGGLRRPDPAPTTLRQPQPEPEVEVRPRSATPPKQQLGRPPNRPPPQPGLTTQVGGGGGLSNIVR